MIRKLLDELELDLDFVIKEGPLGSGRLIAFWGDRALPLSLYSAIKTLVEQRTHHKIMVFIMHEIIEYSAYDLLPKKAMAHTIGKFFEIGTSGLLLIEAMTPTIVEFFRIEADDLLPEEVPQANAFVMVGPNDDKELCKAIRAVNEVIRNNY
ncbi:MAG: hypothetical protein FWH52_05615 [Synergistaceae bacterium]|nr:hypothetical protein [Synergistaceae bacterium]